MNNTENSLQYYNATTLQRYNTTGESMNAQIIENMRYMAESGSPELRAGWLENLRVFCSALIGAGTLPPMGHH